MTIEPEAQAAMDLHRSEMSNGNIHLGTGEVIYLSSIAISLKRIADAMGTSRQIVMPEGSSGTVVGDVAKWDTPPEKRWPTKQGGGVSVADKWHSHEKGERPIPYSPTGSTIRVQFDDGRIETYPYNSTGISWPEVIAYQIINGA